MDREQKEKLMDEIFEMNDIMGAVGLNIDSMVKGFIMLAFVQEAFSEIKAEAAEAKFEAAKTGFLVGPVSVTPSHCSYMEGLTYDRQTNEWSAKCSITERPCNVEEYGLAAYTTCLHYRAYEVSKKESPPPPLPPRPCT